MHFTFIALVPRFTRNLLFNKNGLVPWQPAKRHRFRCVLSSFIPLSIKLVSSEMNLIGTHTLYLSHLRLIKTFRTTLFHAHSPVRQFHQLLTMSSPLKRKASTAAATKSKKAKVTIPEYHLAPSRQDESGEIVWPAPKNQIERAREVIREW